MSPHHDLYDSMTELLRHETEGKDYEFKIEEDNRDERVLVMAPHGGGIEPHTDGLGREIAGDEFTFYTFRGMKPRHNYDLLHVKSTNFDESEAVRLAMQAEVVLAVHGKSGDGEFAMIGGRHRALVGRVETVLEEFEIETRDPPPTVAATNRDNICNRCRQGGVQLELSKPLRKHFRRDSDLRRQFAHRLHRLLHEANTG